MSKLTPEARLKKLRKLECNLMCPNCGTTAPQGLGFGNVCVKFNTFICDLCKTSHQAISHRVKSITMSNWTNEEVDALTTEFCGGNEAALHIWLQNAPGFGQKYRGGSRPKEGDRIDIFKKFVGDCYDVGMFKATTPFSPSVHTTPKHSAAAGAVRATSGAGAPASPVVKITKPSADPFDDFNSGSAASSPKPAGRDPFGSGFSSTTDLLAQAAVAAPPVSVGPASSSTGLLFDAFDDTPPSASPFPTAGFAAPASTSTNPAAAAPAASAFDFMTPSTDPFSNFNSSANSTSNTNKGSAGFSSFNSFNSDVAVAPSTSGFDFMAADPFANSSSIASSNNASQNDLFSFSNSMSPSPVPPSAVSAPASAAHAPVDDPFGSVFLQPVSVSGTGSGVPSPYGNPAVGIGMTGTMSGGMNAGMGGGMGGPMSGGMSGGMSGMGNRSSGMLSAGSGGGHSPTAHSMHSPAMGMNMGMGVNTGMNTGMGGGMGNNNMRAPGMGMSPMGGPINPSMGMGMSPMNGPMGGPMSGPMGGGMNWNTGMAFRPAPSAGPGRGVDAIGDAFGNLNMAGPAGPGNRGAPVPAQQGPASFDFLQGTVKQQLSSLPAGSGAGSGGMNAARGMSPMGGMGAMGARPAMGQGMNMGAGSQQQQGYPSAFPPYPPQQR